MQPKVTCHILVAFEGLGCLMRKERREKGRIRVGYLMRGREEDRKRERKEKRGIES